MTHLPGPSFYCIAGASAKRLALEIGHPVYDCLYLVLAQAHDLPLATFDDRLRRAARLWRIAVFPMKGRA